MTNYTQTPAIYTLARGILMVKIDGESSWQDLMHVKDVKINVTADELEHENVRKALKVVDKNITTKMTAKGSFMCDVPDIENINLWLMSNGKATISQTSGVWTAQNFIVVKPNQWQELGKTDLTITAITDDAGIPVPLEEGTDYYINLKRGLFLPLSQSALVGVVGDGFKITGTYPTQSHDRVHAGKTPIKRHVWFQGDPATGRIIDIKGFCNLKPNGDLPLLSEEWVGFSFDMSFNAHQDYPLSPVGLYYDDLGAV